MKDACLQYNGEQSVGVSMDRVHQVFISSTFTDLEDERRQVSNTLAKAGFITAGMELFPATDHQQLDFIKRVIDRSDYYVVIVGNRYGSLDPDGVSYTEREFEYARSRQLPILAFLHKNPEKIESGKSDSDPEQKLRLAAFKDKLTDKRIVQFWTTEHDLCTAVLVAVSQAVNLSPRIGWVRGDQAIDPRVFQEIEKVRLENSELKARLAAYEDDEIIFDPTLIGPDDDITVEVPLRLSDGAGGTQPIGSRPVTTNLGELYLGLYDTLLTEPREHDVGASIGHLLMRKIADLPDRTNSGAVPPTKVKELRFQFEALGLIESIGESAQTQFGLGRRQFVIWRPSDKGRRFVLQRRAVWLRASI